MSTHRYSNQEITVTFEPNLCINAGICAKELSEVFRTSVIPWINLDNANNKCVMKQVYRCPSKALKCYLNKKEAKLAV